MYLVGLPIKKREKIAEKTYEINFDLEGQEFNFQPGQYIRVTIPKLLYEDPRGNYRDFSICSSPYNKKGLSIAVRDTGSGYKRSLLDMPLGLKIRISGPHGRFTLPKDTKIPLAWIAGGIGIAPFMSKIRLIDKRSLPYKITLFYVNDNKETAAYLKELKILSEKNKFFNFFEIYTHIDGDLIKKHIKDTNPYFYIAGPPLMVEEVLKSINIPKRTFTEDFLGFEPGESAISKAISRRLAVDAVSGKEESMLSQVRNAVLLESLDKAATVSETDAEGTVVYVNDKFVEVSKYERSEIIGQNHRMLKSGYHPPSFYKDLWETISSGHVWRGEVKNKAKNGTFYWVDTIITPILGKDGIPIKYTAVRFLITEQKLAGELKKHLEELEKAKEKTITLMGDLRDEKAKSEAMLQSIGEGVVAIDKSGKVTTYNKQSIIMFGLNGEDVRGKFYDEVFILEDEKGNRIKKEQRPAHRALNSGAIVSSAESYIRRGEKERIPVSITASPIILSKKTIGVILTFKDITQEVEVGKSKSEFISLASHQLRTPLSTISWAAERILDIDGHNKKTGKYVQSLYKSTQKAVGLVNDLLDVSRIELGTQKLVIEEVNMHKLIKEVVDELKQQIIQKKLKFIKNYKSKVVNFNTDAYSIKNILSNLLSNAVKFTPSEGKISLTLDQKDNFLIFEVCDTGYGIPKREQPRIFEKLFRAKNINASNEGTGLGLYIVKALVLKMNGKIAFKSQINKGTCFLVELPKI